MGTTDTRRVVQACVTSTVTTHTAADQPREAHCRRSRPNQMKMSTLSPSFRSRFRLLLFTVDWETSRVSRRTGRVLCPLSLGVAQPSPWLRTPIFFLCATGNLCARPRSVLPPTPQPRIGPRGKRAWPWHAHASGSARRSVQVDRGRGSRKWRPAGHEDQTRGEHRVGLAVKVPSPQHAHSFPTSVVGSWADTAGSGP